MLLKIPRLYDSHTHFIATGEFAGGLTLKNLKSAEELEHLELKDSYFRGDWLMGFGWDDTLWAKPPHKNILDRLFPNNPVFFARLDGHRCWLNTRALTYLGFQSESGILWEKDHLQAWDRLPAYTRSQQRGHVLSACKVYNRAGFTHVRDMSCTESLWELLVSMSDAGDLTLAIEENVTSHDIHDFDGVLDLCVRARKTETPFLRMKGVKVFYDGSLGSETAYLSKPYNGKTEGPRGAPLWSLDHVEEVIKRTWAAGLEFSVHTIGDEAAHEVVQLARKVSAQGAVGRLNLEHAQVLRPETIKMMKPLHVRCHMQPCHWLSDRTWLETKLGSLYKYAFPWEALRLAQIPMSFGCDSPVEPPSFLRNKEALEKSGEAGIRKFGGNLLEVHSHPDGSFMDSHTIFENDTLKEIFFAGKKISLE